MTELERLAAQLQEGGKAEEEVFRRFWAQLRAIADRQIAPSVRKHIGPSTAASKALHSFFRVARGGLAPEAEDALRALLNAILKNKIADAVRKAQAEKRSVAREVGTADPELDAGADVEGAAGRVASKEMAESAAAYLRTRLDDTEWMVLNFWLQGLTPQEMQPALAAVAAAGAADVRAIQVRQIQLCLIKIKAICRNLGSDRG